MCGRREQRNEAFMVWYYRSLIYDVVLLYILELDLLLLEQHIPVLKNPMCCPRHSSAWHHPRPNLALHTCAHLRLENEQVLGINQLLTLQELQ